MGLAGPSGLVASEVTVARGWWQRARGLIGRPSISPAEAYVIPRCRRVHTLGMRFPIDALFCDAGLVVLGVQTLPPGRLSRRFPGASLCIELAAGQAAHHSVEPGVRLTLRT